MDSVNRSVVAKVARGLGRRGGEQAEPRGFMGQLNTLYDPIMTLRRNYLFVQTQRMHNIEILSDYDLSDYAKAGSPTVTNGPPW